MPVVLVKNISAVLPRDGTLARGDDAIASVMNGECSLHPIDHGSVHVGCKVDTDARDERIPTRIHEQLSQSSRLALIAGLDLLEDAGLIGRVGNWTLPEPLRERTGIIFASSFEHHEKSLASVRSSACSDTIQAVRRVLSDEQLSERAHRELEEIEESAALDVRKVALQLLLGANVQLAEIVKARGVNTRTTNACASITAAMGIACNAIRVGEADRVLVVACDTLLQPHTRDVVESFVRLRAASVADSVAEAVRPFSDGRAGFVLGDGAAAILLESSTAPVVTGTRTGPQVAVLASTLVNSAYHGTRLDSAHIAVVLGRCVDDVCAKRGLEGRGAFATRAVYVSHETFTSVCANQEIDALEAVFGRTALRDLPIVSTKACTGHQMGAGMEDLIAVVCLREQRLPLMHVPARSAEFEDLRFAQGEPFECDYVIHVAAGMGSHVAIAIYGKASQAGE